MIFCALQDVAQQICLIRAALELLSSRLGDWKYRHSVFRIRHSYLARLDLEQSPQHSYSICV
jgi:hypothetical protein